MTAFLRIFWTWLVAGLLLLAYLLMASECQPKVAHAGAYLEGGAGASYLFLTATDGVWRQRSFGNPYDNIDPAWRVGAGYRFRNDWSVQAYATSLGSIRMTKAKFVGDAEYDPKHGICLAHCGLTNQLQASDSLRAYEVSVSKHFPFGNWEPFVRVGAALLTHRLTVQVTGSTDPGQFHYGRIPATVLGAGLCYGKGLQACLDTSFYHGFDAPAESDQGWAMSNQALVSLFTIKFPIGG